MSNFSSTDLNKPLLLPKTSISSTGKADQTTLLWTLRPFRIFQCCDVAGEMPDGANDRKFRCLYGTAHCSLVIKFVVAYIIIWDILLMQLTLPPYTVFISLIGFATCICSVIGIIIRNPRLLMPLYIYVVGSVFFLFFLGGYYFYVNIFHKEIVIAAFGDKFDDYSWIAHLLDVLLLLLHYWELGVISKCRHYYRYLLEDKQPFELQIRSETNEEFA